ncbi:hypothetical protein Goklo_029455 [Gossypium klotzschianum]|uniref:MADS-box domain-containing protein n=1 Tax=Gossypium klotzschianum TaxID=34286 RepID=A0A7J8W9Y7_9ROSI|nr:hypothetical protein [Gossypium klotzschianum]
MASSDKKTKGKHKIEIKIIENADDRLIAFSKRHTRIYKKITELSILRGGEILFIIFSLAENLIRLVILLLNLSVNAFQTQANILRKPLMLLLRHTVRRLLWHNGHMEQKFVVGGKFPLISLT